MIEIAALLVLALASFRLTTLIVKDTILDRPRAWLHKRFPVSGTYVAEKPKRGKARFVNESEQKWWIDRGTFIGDLTDCAYCAGVWVSVSLGLLWHYFEASHLIISVIAIAGAQLLLSHWIST